MLNITEEEPFGYGTDKHLYTIFDRGWGTHDGNAYILDTYAGSGVEIDLTWLGLSVLQPKMDIQDIELME